MIKLIAFGVLLAVLTACGTGKRKKWNEYSRESSGLVSAESIGEENKVQIFSAKTFGTKGILAHHTWISFIEKGEKEYTVAHVIGWRAYHGADAVVVVKDIPDRKWFGNEAQMIAEIEGEKAKAAIPQIKKLIKEYPISTSYTVWPGPNSNTFIAYIIRRVDELTVELPPEAVGKDYLLTDYRVVGPSQSGTGFQVSLFGLAGFTLGLREGVELHLLGLTFGLDILRPAIKLPFVGRLGFRDQ